MQIWSVYRRKKKQKAQSDILLKFTREVWKLWNFLQNIEGLLKFTLNTKWVQYVKLQDISSNDLWLQYKMSTKCGRSLSKSAIFFLPYNLSSWSRHFNQSCWEDFQPVLLLLLMESGQINFFFPAHQTSVSSYNTGS